MRITIVGGGNIGTQFAVHCAEAGHEVVVYTSSPNLFVKRLSIVDQDGNTTHTGVIGSATYDPVEAFRDSELIFITLPANMMRNIAEVILEHASANAMIGVVPGSGGSECAFAECIKRGNIFFGIERVPAIARLVKKGETVRSVGYRNELHIAALPALYTDRCCKVVENIFRISCKAIPEYLNLTMTPSNPILHTTRLRSMFGDYKKDVIYDSVPLFYEDWDDSSSELLLACDEEVQKICGKLVSHDLRYVISLKEHYESHSIPEMTSKISSIPAFRGIMTPMIRSDGGYIPDFSSRYFVSDFSYGLVILKQIADFASASVPHIDEILDWYRSIASEKDEFRYSDYGIGSFDDFEEFYLR